MLMSMRKIEIFLAFDVNPHHQIELTSKLFETCVSGGVMETNSSLLHRPLKIYNKQTI